jgi:hypothetical protein
MAAIELRRKHAVTCTRAGLDHCEVFFREFLYSAPLEIETRLRECVDHLQEIENGFIGLAKNPEEVLGLIRSCARRVEDRRENPEAWLPGGMEDPFEKDYIMFSLALRALPFDPFADE